MAELCRGPVECGALWCEEDEDEVNLRNVWGNHFPLLLFKSFSPVQRELFKQNDCIPKKHDGRGREKEQEDTV